MWRVTIALLIAAGLVAAALYWPDESRCRDRHDAPTSGHSFKLEGC